MNYRGNLLLFIYLLFAFLGNAQLMENKAVFTHSDTLRGTITDYRKGWNVVMYDLTVQPEIMMKTIQGKVTIFYTATQPYDTMQIDLQQPLIIDSIIAGSNIVPFIRESNVALLKRVPGVVVSNAINELTVYYHGTPKEAKKAPWDGGVIWKKDEEGNPWIATACQGLGASVWWPCKDHQSDEPEQGMNITIIAPENLSAISNGRLIKTAPAADGNKAWTWQVVNPINNYDVTMNIGKYTRWNDTLMGEAGKLDLEYWVLNYNLEKAKEQFNQVKPMLRSHEYWFGPYPFYKDSYKLVETPFLGMEHQSAVAYGNAYKNGYLGKDLSGTGWGLKWDFIIIHESGHEWFGNNITSKDLGDMWVHEGFTNYSETLFSESLYGIEAGDEYNRGTRKKISNDKPIIGPYGVNKEGSGDMYYKGGNLLQLVRHSINNDELFRNILRGLNKTFYHSTVTTAQVEEYISKESSIDFSKVWDQYLRTTQIPALEYYIDKKKNLCYRWSNCVSGFDLSLVLKNSKQEQRISPTTKWQKSKPGNEINRLWSPSYLEKNYCIAVKQTGYKP